MGKRNLGTVALLCCLFLCLFLPLVSYGEVDWQTENNATGFVAVIEDQADLINGTDLKKVGSSMLGITEFCNVGFYTYAGDDEDDVLQKAKNWGDQLFSDSDYTVFIIDMAVRKIGLYSSTYVYKALTTEVANEITGNTYTYASQGQFAKCAQESFRLVQDKLFQFMDLISDRWFSGPDFMITEERLHVFNKGIENEDEAFFPLAYLGTLTNDNMNHAYLCAIPPADSGKGYTLAVVYLEEDPEGNVSILNVLHMNLGILYMLGA